MIVAMLNVQYVMCNIHVATMGIGVLRGAKGALPPPPLKQVVVNSRS